ncbi:zinc metalloprotease HtpX [Nocardiopsis dassonvillei]|uniref:Protease HtpX homolog n=1 Tax=Nocardiopsis dassonvillei (strain ATCC 23218 / DSM 43111 / CIP 107115 / JCM 7437 / KCTC 9190 / NBRC 14626 / NCTC 10488 / NRRL B-5397 / IMRU 509) TaxID=446468 RepID=D7B0J1_NOCDD|nr:zinc metalloprotease HtpX [Nocardiopsis dassonvillei]ADH66398.1 peptidase M48 Ste24p [Nocardiopsis dassonvillei subsp. dassonvillei DSM 43111]NKY77863.1 zinc metalloprotease HtpX [Nocardiopsis dassonvillei]VEI92419.1 Protease HtpX homolog [Nocardiopsis dassonvillei]
MAGSKFRPDRGLTTRMVTTMGLLVLVYAAFVVGLVLVGLNVWLVLLIVAGFALFSYFASDRIAMFAMGAKEVSPEQAPELHALIDRLCAMADMSKPRVGIADTDVPNAFATGHNEKSAVVCVTTGLMRRLDGPELEAVLAHELSHIAHRDVMVMTVAGFLGIVAGFLTQAGLRFAMFAGATRGNNSNGPAPAVVALLVVAVSAVAWALSFLLTRALSRYRELSADRAAAYLTGRPSVLGSALTKITGDMSRIPTRDLRQAEPFNAFFFAPASSREGFSFSQLVATHPPVQQRLEQLSDISRQLGQGR